MQLLVSGKTKTTYTQEHLKFITYLYDLDADEYISDWALDDLHKGHDKDQEEERTQRNRRHLRESIRHHLNLMNRFDKNCRIILPKLSFALFTKYMIDIRSMDDNNNVCYMSSVSYGTIKKLLGVSLQCIWTRDGGVLEQRVEHIHEGSEKDNCKGKGSKWR